MIIMKKYAGWIGLGVGAFLLVGLIGAGLQTNNSEVKTDVAAPVEAEVPETYQVVAVVDGDTIKVDYHGKTTSVRLIGVNTPETVDPRKDVECFGEEASQFLRSLLEGKAVRLEPDISQSDRDKYDRLLRYIYLDGEDVSLTIIQNGYGYEYTYNVPYQKQARYRAAQTEAENGKRGLWADGVCTKSEPVATKPQTPENEPANTSKPQNTAPVVTAPATSTQHCKIKGNISSSGEKIYHMPGQQFYDKTVIDTSKGERWFCTEQEAVNAGWRKSKR